MLVIFPNDGQAYATFSNYILIATISLMSKLRDNVHMHKSGLYLGNICCKKNYHLSILFKSQYLYVN